jgi:dihydroorotate dehydrogenase
VDPVETLRKLRELSAAVLANASSPNMPRDAVELAEKVQELDSWMSGVRNGYSPWDTERDRANRAGMPPGVQIGDGNTQINHF